MVGLDTSPPENDEQATQLWTQPDVALFFFFFFGTLAASQLRPKYVGSTRAESIKTFAYMYVLFPPGQWRCVSVLLWNGKNRKRRRKKATL